MYRNGTFWRGGRPEHVTSSNFRAPAGGKVVPKPLDFYDGRLPCIEFADRRRRFRTRLFTDAWRSSCELGRHKGDGRVPPGASRDRVMLDFQNTPEMASPALVPEQVVDREHLSRMTLGDRSLEGEVLRLFERQADMLIARMAMAAPANIKALAHTLDGSARGIGAWRVSQAAKDVERAVAENGDVRIAIASLKSAVDEALIIIADLLQVH